MQILYSQSVNYYMSEFRPGTHLVNLDTSHVNKTLPCLCLSICPHASRSLRSCPISRAFPLFSLNSDFNTRNLKLRYFPQLSFIPFPILQRHPFNFVFKLLLAALLIYSLFFFFLPFLAWSLTQSSKVVPIPQEFEHEISS